MQILIGSTLNSRTRTNRMATKSSQRLKDGGQEAATEGREKSMSTTGREPRTGGKASGPSDVDHSGSTHQARAASNLWYPLLFVVCERDHSSVIAHKIDCFPFFSQLRHHSWNLRKCVLMQSERKGRESPTIAHHNFLIRRSSLITRPALPLCAPH